MHSDLARGMLLMRCCDVKPCGGSCLLVSSHGVSINMISGKLGVTIAPLTHMLLIAGEK